MQPYHPAPLHPSPTPALPIVKPVPPHHPAPPPSLPPPAPAHVKPYVDPYHEPDHYEDVSILSIFGMKSHECTDKKTLALMLKKMSRALITLLF